MVKRRIVKMLKAFLNARYRRHCKRGRSNTVLLLSRQSNTLSTDFRLIEEQVGKLDGWSCTTCIQMLDGGLGSKIAYALHMLQEVKLLAQCKICFIEGYNPALSLLDMESVSLPGNTPNDSAPTSPVVMQIWHAGGMYKKFGFMCLDTPEGRSTQSARLLQMHRNCSWIVVSGEAARRPFAEALGYPVERVVALGRPSFDLLLSAAENAKDKEHPKPRIVFAPTLHRTQDELAFDELRAALETSDWASDYELIWSYHPVATLDAAQSTSQLLASADLLVTDYSSIVYDAAILAKPVFFYVPDIDEYRRSPGLITDPGKTSPSLCLVTPDELMAAVDALAKHGSYPQDELHAFIGRSLDACTPGSTERIVRFAIEQVGR